MKTKQIFRTLCLVAVMCMVSANALAYDVYDVYAEVILVNPSHRFSPCKILVVDEDATVYNCDIFEGGVLIIKEGKTVTVEDNFNFNQGTIYVYGTLNIEHTNKHRDISRSTVYIMQGGSLVGSYYDQGGNTISTNVAPAAAGSIEKVDAQVPTPANSFVGWPDYYQQRIYSTDGTDFYPIAYYEDAAHTQPIVDLDAWKTNYSNPYHAAYDAGAAAAYTAPTEPGMRMKVTKKDGKVYEFQVTDVESTEYYRATE